ncbi:MurR/RpiR family transcriptional regulator [Saccharopolyspora sp. K220]|uniref:MurR/RpiR family transcriptional regulator n=1 Tax=Saccharopolyspora soli TaxID=2926618 RepID=UPI001F571CFC|nr:MurR/RpiR family transcriptional regulator [Saccharopolyspora soli]MCI2423873.1 MurR/RpiR family transcriptional regulator [Saccharopolyspora soli]
MDERDDTQQGSVVTGLTRNQGILDLRARIREHWDSLSPSAQEVCRLLGEITPEQLLYKSAVDLGAETRTSNATVVRALQSLGYTGLADLKTAVARPFTDTTAPEMRARSRVEATKGDLPNVWNMVAAEWVDRINLMRASFSVEDYQQTVELMLGAREIVPFGFGSSYVVAEHLAFKLRRIGRRARPIHSSGFCLPDDLLGLERGDVVILFAPGRLVIDIDVLLSRVRTVGATSVLVTAELVDQLKDSVDVLLIAPHSPTGLTGDTATAMVVADALIQGVAASDVENTVQSSHTLNTLRQQMGF